MPDIRIEYAAQPPAYVEAVVDIDPEYAAMEVEVWKPPRPIPADQVWHVRVSGQPNLKRLRRDLPAIIQDLREPPGPYVNRIAKMGVSITGPSEPTAAQPGGIYLLPEGVSGSPFTAWPVFLDWINNFLASSRAHDVRAKLAATDATERHAFVGASFTAPGAMPLTVN